MKKLILLLLLFKAFQCEAQPAIKGSIELKDSVINRNITFKIEKGCPRLKYYVQGYLTTGKLSVTFTDPDGKDGGAFQLETNQNSSGGKKSAKGNLSHSKTDPMPGTWVMNVSVEGGTGSLSYQIYPERP